MMKIEFTPQEGQVLYSILNSDKLTISMNAVDVLASIKAKLRLEMKVPAASIPSVKAKVPATRGNGQP